MQVIVELNNRPVNDYLYALTTDPHIEEQFLVFVTSNIFTVTDERSHYIFIKQKSTGQIVARKEIYTQCIDGNVICPVIYTNSIKLIDSQCEVIYLDSISITGEDNRNCEVVFTDTIQFVECQVIYTSTINLEEVDPEPPVDVTSLIPEYDFYFVRNTSTEGIYFSYESGILEDEQVFIQAGQVLELSLSQNGLNTHKVYSSNGTLLNSNTVTISYRSKGKVYLNQMGGYPTFENNIFKKRVEFVYNPVTKVITNNSNYDVAGTSRFYKIDEAPMFGGVLNYSFQGFDPLRIYTIKVLFINERNGKPWEEVYTAFLAIE